ncbi:MAG: flagellar hook-associated protein FlgK [Alphaproteobacteria bacterium]|nr:flagellar hook-associated protein FlgK [Alphaproteobacteria bacterium]
MSLSLALNTALSGLAVNKAALDVLAHNVANANTPGYSRQVLEQSPVILTGIGAGVQIDQVSRKVDDYLQRAIRDRNSVVGGADVLNDYMSRLQVMFGEPESDPTKSSSLDGYVTRFFNALSNLSQTPDLASVRANALTAGRNLAEQVSTLANSVNDLRYQADQDINNKVTYINQQLQNLQNINAAINQAVALGNPLPNLLDERDKALNNLAQNLDIQTYFRDNGEVTVSTANGIMLVTDNTVSELTYTPAASQATFVNNAALYPIEVVRRDSDGNILGTPETLVSSGTRGDITSRVRSGELYGLLQIRDVEMVNVLDQLDQFAFGLTAALNAVHNDGAGFPPPSELTGQRLINPDLDNTWNGSVRIAAVNLDGSPAASHHPGEPGGYMRPLTMDLTQIYGPNAVGSPSTTDIIKEINANFGPPQSKVVHNGLNDIRMISVSDDITAGGNFTFDLEFENILSGANSGRTVTITNVVTSAGAPVTAFPVGPVTANAGGWTRGGLANNIQVNFGGSGAATFDIDIDIQVDDGVNPPVTATIRYTVTNNTTGIRNDRTVAGSVVAGTAGIVAPTVGSGATITASLVDADGNPAPLGSSGYLKLTAASGIGIAIDEMDSRESGIATTNPPTAATSYGFSHYFGLNNFYDEDGTLLGSATRMAVREDILTNPNLISTGELVQSPTYNDPTLPNLTTTLYSYQLGAGNNAIAKRLADLSNSQITFAAAGTIPAVNLRPSDYAGEILAYNAARATATTNDLTQQNILLDGFLQRSAAISGVNVDEEMANTLIYQHAYAASARVITVADEMLTTLLNSF